jgi:tryptophan synthase alpha chain
MMNRIDETFTALRSSGTKGFIAYLTAGDPDLVRSFAAAQALAEAGVDILELGIPFSDPLADGPTIQSASQRALEAGATVEKLLDHLHRFRKQSPTPVVLFTYLNPVYAYGYEEFHKAAVQAGADGILILDLPPDEAACNQELAGSHGLKSIRLIAPTTPEERIGKICQAAEGFLYYVSREGVTGEQQSLADGISERVATIRKHSSLPIAVGFGIGTPEQAAQVSATADAAVVGSAIVRTIAEANQSGKDVAQAAADFVRPMVQAVHAVC